MKEIKLKEDSKKVKVAFGKRALPLGQRSPDDLKQLAIIAHESGNANLLAHFESIPTLAELKADKVDKEVPQLPVKQDAAKV